MTQLQFMRSNTFRWASAVAGVFAAFIVILFGFIYWKIDRYLIERSDRMIMQQIDFLAALPVDRRIDAIADHLAQDSRGVQFAGLFGADGSRLAGNLQSGPGGHEPVRAFDGDDDARGDEAGGQGGRLRTPQRPGGQEPIRAL